ncbi:MAG: hypothetical protein ACRCZB_03860 [Bacteroidales bacterium]
MTTNTLIKAVAPNTSAIVRMRDMEGISMQEPLLVLLTEVHRTLKRDISPEDLAIDVQMLASELKEQFGALDMEEVQFAFRRGARGYYDKDGNVYALSIATYHKWLKCYQYGPDRREFLNEKRLKENEGCKLLTSVASPKSAEEKRADDIAAIIDCFETYSKMGLMYFGFIYYDMLHEFGLLEYTYSNVRSAYRKAKQDKTPKKKVRCALAKAIEKLPIQSNIKWDVKIILLKQYFDAIIAQNKHIKEMIVC